MSLIINIEKVFCEVENNCLFPYEIQYFSTGFTNYFYDELMDFYLIREYKTDNMREEQRVMNEYIENLSEGMYRIDRQLYNIY